MVDPEGLKYALFRGVVDHWFSDHSKETRYLDKVGAEQPRMSTLGWELCVQWADGTSNWLPLADLKKSNPVEVAKYAVSRKLDKEPAFCW
jgi:hypothetical protein